MTTPGRSMWAGAIAFGPVYIPVKMYTATEEREGIKFHQVHRQDGARIQMRRFCSENGEEVPYADVAKGLEWGGQTLVFTDEDMAAVALPTNKRIEIEHFCPRDEISDMLPDKQYYLTPDKGAERAYWLLRSAMVGRVGVGRVTIRSRERVVMLAARADGILMTTLRYPEEVRDMPEFPAPLSLGEQEVALATQLVEAMVDKFDPAAYTDRWADAVRKVAEDKAAGVKAEAVAPEAEVSPAVDLIAVLQAGVAAIKAEKAKNAEKAGE